jgi:early secretory antigenic target protein ESAT-6
MSDVTYSYNFAVSSDTISLLSTIPPKIQAELDQLDSQVKAHLADWNSQARSEYETAKNTWTTAAQDMPSALQSMAAALQQVHDLYHGAETRNAGRWQR